MTNTQYPILNYGLTMPNIVTGTRLVFFILFIWAAAQQRAGLALALWLPAWGMDAIDGWLARKLKQETPFGYIFDKAVDRLVLFGGVLVVMTEGLVPEYALLLLTKDIAVLPAVTAQLKRQAVMPALGMEGKIMTVLQGVGFAWLVLGWPGGEVIVGAVALLGGVSGYRYLRSFP
jgi:phosphatidylglycerophosphate synthase